MKRPTTQLIILDRDGVINRDLGTYVTAPDAFEFIDGAIEAIAHLKNAGFTIAIATNQAGIGRGLYSHETLSAIHAKMLRAIRIGGGDIDRIVYCPSYDDAHPWRKPNAGMLVDILRGFNLSSEQSVFIGDTVRDMQAGFSVGCQLMMVKGKNAGADGDGLSTELKPCVRRFADLREASRIILSEND